MLLYLKAGDEDLLLITEPALLTRCACNRIRLIEQLYDVRASQTSEG